MRGFEKLQELKDNMMKPIYEKRRHLGCELCGTTFYGYYKNTGTNAVPNGEESPHPTREGWIRVHTYDDVFYPDCPDCWFPTFVRDAKTAKLIFEREQEKSRKKEERRKERKAKKDAQPVYVDYKLRFENRQAYNERIIHLAESPDDLTKYEIMSSYFLDKIFWKKFGKGCHTLESRHFTIKKHLYDGTYRSNSGKTRMGSFTPYFEVTNNKTGKVREVGTDSVLRHIERREQFGTNRRNDPKRNWGLPKNG